MTLDDVRECWAEGRSLFWNNQRVFVRGIIDGAVLIANVPSLSSRLPAFEHSVSPNDLSLILK